MLLAHNEKYFFYHDCCASCNSAATWAGLCAHMHNSRAPKRMNNITDDNNASEHNIARGQHNELAYYCAIYPNIVEKWLSRNKPLSNFYLFSLTSIKLPSSSDDTLQ
jgi:hypothetical protein